MNTIISNIAAPASVTGNGNQSHLIYAANTGRWWFFYFDSLTATTVKCRVSSSNDVFTASWSDGTASGAFPNSRALSSNDNRNLAVEYQNNGGTDVIHVSVGIGVSGSTGYLEHVRATITASTTISWETWEEKPSNGTYAWNATKGNAVGVSSTGVLHESAITLLVGMNPQARVSLNADTGASWTSGWNDPNSSFESVSSAVNMFAFAKLASGAMLLVYDNGAVASPDSTGLRAAKFTSGNNWVGVTPGDVGIGSSTQDECDWCLCRVDDTHIYVFRRSGSNSFLWRKHDGSSTWSTPANGVPNQTHLARSGMFAASDGTNLWLFLLDSATNQPVMYCKCTGANDPTPTWGSWTQLEAAGSAARNSISGYPVVANSQIGVIYTVVNGSNFDIAVSALDITPVVLNQEGFRFRRDDGSETTATWLAAQDTNISATADTNTRLRILVDATGNPDTKKLSLQYRVNGGNWRRVPQ